MIVWFDVLINYEEQADYNNMDTRVDILEDMIRNDAGFHNSIYRGKDVTSYLTATGDNNLINPSIKPT